MSNISDKIKIIFFGSFEFAVYTAESLASHDDYEITAVVTNPDKPAGRKKVISESPVKTMASASGIRVFQPEKIKGNIEFFKELRELNADVGIVVGYGRILPLEILDIPRHGLLNIHPSLLPKYRGPSPVQAALLNCETKTGVSVMKIDEEMDHGPILAQAELEILPEDTTDTLLNKLFALGTKLLIDVLPKYISGNAVPVEQDHSQATFSKMLLTKDGEIFPGDTIIHALNKIRALNPEPGAFTVLPNGKRLKILKAIITTDPSRPHLKLSDGMVELVRVQPEGRNQIAGSDWWRGLR